MKAPQALWDTYFIVMTATSSLGDDATDEAFNNALVSGNAHAHVVSFAQLYFGIHIIVMILPIGSKTRRSLLWRRLHS